MGKNATVGNSLLLIILAITVISENDFIIFRAGGREGEREGEKHQCVRDTAIGCLSHTPKLEIWPTAQACALTEN